MELKAEFQQAQKQKPTCRKVNQSPQRHSLAKTKQKRKPPVSCEIPLKGPGRKGNASGVDWGMVGGWMAGLDRTEGAEMEEGPTGSLNS